MVWIEIGRGTRYINSSNRPCITEPIQLIKDVHEGLKIYIYIYMTGSASWKSISEITIFLYLLNYYTIFNCDNTVLKKSLNNKGSLNNEFTS